MDRLRALEAVLQTTELGSFSAAARALGVKQSTVSKWVAQLEEDLGTRLFDRTTRRLRPTAAGRRLAHEGRAVLAAWHRATAQAAADALSGPLHLGLPAVYGERCVVPLLAEVLEAHPRLQLVLHLADARVDPLSAGLDLVLRLGPTADSSLRSRVLAHHRRVLVASPALLASRGCPDHPDALAAWPALPHLGVRDQRWTLQREEERCTVALSPRLVCDHSGAALALAERGLGVARLASWLVAPALGAGRLVELLPDWSAGSFAVRALWSPAGPGPDLRRRALLDALEPGLRAVDAVGGAQSSVSQSAKKDQAASSR